MSKIRLFGTSSGYVEIAPAAAASNNTLTVPSTVGEIIAKDAAGAIGITSMKASNVNVGAAVTITESGIEASGIGITVANINGGAIGGRRNIIINGAMQVAQRGTSATSVSGEYKTVDRLSVSFSGEDEDPTEAQHTLTSSDTGPYAEGFRKSFHLTNGNQTSGAGAGDYLQPQYKIEAQDIANSGWDYTSSSSYITISFWAKSSVAGDYTFNLDTQDGTGYRYLMEYTLVADTWKKITKTIPGNSNLTVNDDTGLGLQIMWYPFLGSNYVQADQENNWYASSNGKYGTTSTTNWWTTNDSTWEITGVQLEVGDQATAFEHRSFAEELALCQRYCYVTPYGGSSTAGAGDEEHIQGTSAFNYSESGGTYTILIMVTFPQPMRETPTYTGSSTNAKFRSSNTSNNFQLSGLSAFQNKTTKNCISMAFSTNIGAPASMSGSSSGFLEFNAAGGYLKFESEF